MDHNLEDALTTLQAQLNHIQNRLMQMACRGKSSRGICNELAEMAADMQERLLKLAEGAN